jgi:cell fate regulator YaaT (PSP1 superfamily)
MMTSNDTTQDGSLDPSDANTAGEPIDSSIAAPAYYFVRFVYTSEIASCAFSGEPLTPGRRVVAISRYGKDIATVLGPVQHDSARRSSSEVVRIASDMDVEEYETNHGREAQALALCRQKAEMRNLPMKLLSVHILPEETKILFFFSAEGRVDFRELVKDLVSVFHMRIELRQVGVRDESRLLGGIGVCGRVLCCHSFPDQSCSVSIKMAKEQNLSLGSMKVSGPCGRLMCCLSYEYDYYACEKCRYPRPGAEVTSQNDAFLVADINMISRRILLSGGRGGLISVDLERFHADSSPNRWTVDLAEELEGDSAPDGDPEE